MKKILTFGIMLLFIFMTVSSANEVYLEKQTNQPKSIGKTLYVGGSGPGNYTKIQDAIDDSSDGDTVFVFDDSSPYYENLIVDKSITLQGENKETTVINGSEDRIVINISADGVFVTGFTLHNYGVLNVNSTRIIAIQSDYNVIYDNIITGYAKIGIFINGTTYNNITNNIINGDFRFTGIDVDGCNHTSIYENIISFSTMGISGYYSKNNDFIRNTITNCGFGIDLQFVINGYIYGNIITNNRFYGIHSAILTSNITIFRNNISFNEGVGINYFGNSHNDRIIQNNFIGNEIKNAYFVHPLNWVVNVIFFEKIKPFFPKIYWNENYWDDTRLQIKFITGFVSPRLMLYYRVNNLLLDFFDGFAINWFYLDRNPASEPYDIEV